ncbi:MAG: 5'-3' exoribonuclease [Chlamydiae bacterium]|nr:5'-3' exoribonuclease [Chlamydiota bacterium]
MTRDFRADLHCHTNCSDGSMSPEELIFHAKEVGLSGLSITDHDTINAYRAAIPAAKKAGIALGSGVEFSSVDEGVSVHILGYDFDLQNPSLQDFCKRHIERRKSRNERILEKLATQGIFIDHEELEKEMSEDHPVGRPHIALALVRKGVVSSVQEAFMRFIGDGKPCFDPGIPISTDETIDIIHEAGGKAFIAHPHLLHNSKLGEKLLKKPFNGIECFYSKCTPQQEQKWVNKARERGLLMSGGSDFHGAIKPGIPLGCSWVDQTTFEQIFQKHRCC